MNINNEIGVDNEVNSLRILKKRPLDSKTSTTTSMRFSQYEVVLRVNQRHFGGKTW